LSGHSRPQKADIVGCGDVGLRLARLLSNQGIAVRGVVRSSASAAVLRGSGIEPLVIDLDTAEAEGVGAPAEWQFYFAPPPSAGTGDSRLRRWLRALVSAPRRLVYISTSGVYGDCQGRWIDEDESLKPQTDRARRRLDAESALREYAAAHVAALTILRVPGIYGPGRLPVERLRQGLPVLRLSESPWSNRIHAEDLAAAALAAALRGRSGQAYNVSDGQPTSMSDYFLRCARLLGLPEPPQLELEDARRQLTPAMLSFLEESKRLRNDRMLDELGVALRYPDLDTGLPSCLA
jgi:nucleoside-diphosphate-sugar epimerase